MGKIKPIKVGRRPAGPGTRPGLLLNLGPKSTARLVAAGLRSRDQLLRLGPIGVCRRLIEAGQPVSVLMAYAIEGGLTGTHWNALPWETKSWLRTAFAQMKRAAARGPKPRRPRG